MNPEHRVELNSTGFCADHLWKLLGQRKNHSYSLAMHTYLKTLMDSYKKIVSPQSISSKEAVKSAKKLENELQSCLVCRGIDQRMDRYGATAAHLWSKDTEFRQLFEQQYICIQHLPLLIYRGVDMLRGKELKSYITSIGTIMEKTTTTLESDIQHYTQMYKGENQGKPWGRAEGALDRVIAFLGAEHTDL